MPLVLENTTPGDLTGRSITVHLEGVLNNRQGIGATVVFTMDSGAMVSRLMGAGGVSRASLPAEVHAGLAEGDAVEAIIVTWPNGATTTVDRPRGPVLVIREE